MNLKEIKAIAKEHNLTTGKLSKSELVRAIQQSEGNLQCFGSCSHQSCGQPDCLWRAECF